MSDGRRRKPALYCRPRRDSRLPDAVRCAVLTYHSQIFTADGYAGNDHVRLAEDLRRIHAARLPVVPLQQIVDLLLGRVGSRAMDRAVCITFDDGALLDFEDVKHPDQGPQRGFLNILRDFRDEHGKDALPSLHATSFVIACPEARRRMDQRSLFGLGWMGHDWWPQAAADPMLSLGSHGWDHHHPDVDPADPARGRFDNVDTEAACRRQVVDASRLIAELSGGTWPCVFAYPFGQASDYLRQEFLPRCTAEHRLDAAVSTEPDYVTESSDRWWLPRFVAGRDWKTPEDFDCLLAGLSR